jgi:hypothetical protein
MSEPDGDDLIYTWTIGDIIFQGWRNHTLETNFEGNLSSEDSPLNVSVVVSDGRDTELNLTLEWTVIIIDVDRPFTVVFDPEPGLLTMEHNGSVTISYNAFDPDGNEVVSTWFYLDRYVPLGNTTSIIVSATDLGLTGGEIFNITLKLSSGTFTSNFNWTVNVSKPPPEPEEPEFLPPVGARIISPVESQRFKERSLLFLSADDEDTRNLTFTWTLNDTQYIGQEVNVSWLGPGNYTAYLNISSDDEKFPGWVELQVSFEVYKEQIGPPIDTDDEDEERFPLWLVPIIIAISVALLIVGFLMVRGRDKELKWEE